MVVNLMRKFVGGLLAICPDLMLGREGPCIEMGTMTGQGLAKPSLNQTKIKLRNCKNVVLRQDWRLPLVHQLPAQCS